MTYATPQDFVSRFFTKSDDRQTTFVYELPPESWWSRHYEYAWAAKFVDSTDVALDAASGVGHPFKFYLGQTAKEAFACDLDRRILSKEAVLQNIRDTIGAAAFVRFDSAMVDPIHYANCDMSETPYGDAQFDKIFCISVLEHVEEQTQRKALGEFWRILKHDGLIVMTVDYPTVNMSRLAELVGQAELEFAGEADFSVPDDAVSSAYWGMELKCIRLVLKKKR